MNNTILGKIKSDLKANGQPTGRVDYALYPDNRYVIEGEGRGIRIEIGLDYIRSKYPLTYGTYRLLHGRIGYRLITKQPIIDL